MRPIEEIRAAFHRIHRVATGHSTEAFMSIPANPDRDADLIVSAALDELEGLRAQVEPSALHEASFAVHGALGWGFDPMAVSPVSLARAAAELAKEYMTLRAALARAQELQRGAEAQHCAALARVGELEAKLEETHRIDALVVTTRALREALRELVRVMSHQLARGEDPEEGAFDRAWVAACAALREKPPPEPTYTQLAANGWKDPRIAPSAEPPCGGSRCHQSPGGEWIHSSKSYGSCAVRGEGAPSSGTPRFDLVAHLHRQRAFSKRTFGPGERTAGVLDHIRKELLELEQAPGDLTEWIDVVLLAFDGAWRAGHSPEAIAQALEAKQTKNESRTWPDWRTAEPGKAIEHVRGEGGHG